MPTPTESSSTLRKTLWWFFIFYVLLKIVVIVFIIGYYSKYGVADKNSTIIVFGLGGLHGIHG
ncbi:COX3 domain-containing protein [Caenorhabditis elegans]|uniref:COX3 domain-containing protein n=1 Tax=Caenorhabditis elegans TaxID=6239 RepID=Q965P3_CAEEL|nr:COX3 domain-containing protein [Caenorhabditis elegans]CCD73742.2 COX3 domain-containing protein [Caenorhabditis elegans]